MAGPAGLAAVFLGILSSAASNLDVIGVTLLRAVTTNLNGSGIPVAQVEAPANGTTPYAFEASPSVTGLAASRFTWISGLGSSTTFPNSIGLESGHADQVGTDLYGSPGGVATNVSRVSNYEANYFLNSVIPVNAGIGIKVVNQSFTIGSYNSGDDQAYDNFAAKNYTLFVTGAGFNNTNVYSPATCYNGIGVGVVLPGTPHGPTPDGRSKPDLIAPGIQDTETSYATPQVAGGAVLLQQAGARGDGGPATNAAVDIRTIKALLLNGAVKPADWTNSPTTPLDARFGAGVLNVFNSYEQLAGGKHGWVSSNGVALNGAHPPAGTNAVLPVTSGWDFATNASRSTADGVTHYVFFLGTNGNPAARYTATATLVWNRQQSQSSINNLDLFLYDSISGNLIDSSVSAVDNVEHLFVQDLPPGWYELQVLKHGGSTVSATEAYALAYEFFSMQLTVSSNSPVVLSWPIYPAGFVLESTPVLGSDAAWSPVTDPPALVSGQWQLTVDSSADAQFYRLRRP
ncbi:MAG: S8 family serine peptidase [Verrucomicrobiota bacterium]